MDLKILIINDSKNTNNLYSLMKENHLIVDQTLSINILGSVNKLNPDIIIINFNSYEKLSVIKELKDMGFDQNSIVVVTKIDEQESIEKIYSEGISLFLREPFSIFEIKAIISNMKVLKRTGKRLKDEITKRSKIEWKFRKFVSFSVFGMLLIDKDLNISLWNKGAENIFGYKKSEVIGKNFLKFIPLGENKILDFAYQKDRFFEIESYNKKGERINLEISFTIEIFEDNSNIAIFIKDISEHKKYLKLQKESERQREKLKELEAFNATIITLNHNLKQPICSIVSNIQLALNNKNRNKGNDKFLKRIDSSSKTICSIVDKIGNIKNLKYIDYAGRYKMIDLNEDIDEHN
ncbi:MAG: hypothetical protein CR982_07665 [Candidatus Cloacimonadota bacterium]|nr:MAG: hypothetical protein CR982_07665 [Candidatus Cloacimonadota bacterium]PIE78268.1 MAG: hypothetical protein CSA15_08875 [Candidatus Delongbacteria bacterium]